MCLSVVFATEAIIIQSKFEIFRPERYGGSYLKNLAAESPELVGCAGMVRKKYN